MGSTSPWEGLFRWAMGASWVVSFGCAVAIVVIIASVVRRHRPDAWQPLLLWSVASLVLWFASPVVSFVTTRFAASGGVDGVYKSQTLSAAFGIPIHVVMTLLFVRGVVKIAQPPRPVEVDAQPPYR